MVHNEKNDRPDPSAQLYLGAVPLKYEFDPDCTGEDSQIDWIIYRYADVLTLTAEAIVRNKNAVTQEAVNLLNEVRTRSLPGKGYSLQDLNSGQISESCIGRKRLGVIFRRKPPPRPDPLWIICGSYQKEGSING